MITSAYWIRLVASVGPALALVVGLGGAGLGCKKKDSDEVAASATTEELAPTPATAGITWKRIELPFGSAELPSNEGWNLVGTDIQGPDDMVVMLQSQDGVKPEEQGAYLKLYGKLQARDAKGYRAKAHLGTLRGDPAIRIEGTFDNGTKYVTREFLVFAKGKVVALAAHVPAAHGAKLGGIIDQVARTLEVK